MSPLNETNPLVRTYHLPCSFRPRSEPKKYASILLKYVGNSTFHSQLLTKILRDNG